MDFPESEFLEVELTEAQLSEIGLALVSRLAVFEQSKRKRQP
jgi:hypothetical protein